MKQIEDTIFDEALAINSMAVIDRLFAVMNELRTNNLATCRNDTRIKKLMWLLNYHFNDFNSTAIIDMWKLWEEMYHEHETN